MILKDFINQLSMFDENLPVSFFDYDEEIQLNGSEMMTKIKGSKGNEHLVIGFGEEGYEDDYDEEDEWDESDY